MTRLFECSLWSIKNSAFREPFGPDDQAGALDAILNTTSRAGCPCGCAACKFDQEDRSFSEATYRTSVKSTVSFRGGRNSCLSELPRPNELDP